MKPKAIAGSLALVAAATLLVADGAHARRVGANHYGGADDMAGFNYRDGPGWDAAAAAAVEAKAAARARYDAHDYDFLHRCHQPQRIWNGAYYTWRLVSIC
jgi:hypothetical protein